jgi:hypothetical protein
LNPTFAVLNPGGRDRTQSFSSGAGLPSDDGHAPINYHAYAACLSSSFCQSVSDLPASVRTVLLLLRKNGLKDAFKAVRELKSRGLSVWISWKESGLHQVSAALQDPARWEAFREICAHADGFLSSTQDLVALYRQAGCGRGEFVPTPYPVDVSDWNFSQPLAQREGIFIGTREFDVPTRNHLLAVSAACLAGAKVTVFNPDGRRGEKLLRAISPDLNIVPGRLPYTEYLTLMASHRVVFQLDRSAVPGQIAGDALLCRVPCVGGDGANERIAFPDLCGFGRNSEELVVLLKTLLASDSFYEEQGARNRQLALADLSFEAGRQKLSQALGL